MHGLVAAGDLACLWVDPLGNLAHREFDQSCEDSRIVLRGANPDLA